LIPDAAAAVLLHQKYGSNEKVVDHCRAVSKVAQTMIARLEERGIAVDREAVVAAALLHDIGRSRNQTAQHGLIGAQILEQEGVDTSVVEIVRRHVGAGISSAEARILGFPPGDYVPSSLEQRVVCFADKMVDGVIVRPFEEEVRRFIRKGHDVDRLRKLRTDLEDDLGEDPEKVIFNNA
jgi:uncharacterized protein (TIGR00295 family)